jgi:hypothetical protein
MNVQPQDIHAWREKLKIQEAWSTALNPRRRILLQGLMARSAGSLMAYAISGVRTQDESHVVASRH